MLKAVIFQKNLVFISVFFLKQLPGAVADAVLEGHPVSCSNAVQCLLGVLLLWEYFWYFFYRKDCYEVRHIVTHMWCYGAPEYAWDIMSSCRNTIAVSHWNPLLVTRV